MVVLSSCEAEYIEITSAVCQGVWITRLVKEVVGVEIKAVKIMVDNQLAIMLSKTSAHHNITKHIDTCHHFIQYCVEDRRVVIKHVKIEDQLVDILTKSFGRVKFGELSARIRVKKVWDEKKIKEENVGSDFPTWCMASARGTQGRATIMHTRCTLSKYCSTRRDGARAKEKQAEASGSMCHNAPVARNSASTVAPCEWAHAWRTGQAFREDPASTSRWLM